MTLERYDRSGRSVARKVAETIFSAHAAVFVLVNLLCLFIWAAAGFGYTKGKQGIFSTFSAFLEMCWLRVRCSAPRHPICDPADQLFGVYARTPKEREGFLRVTEQRIL